MRSSVPPFSSTTTARRPREFKHVSMTPHARSSNIVLYAGAFHPEIHLGSCLIPHAYNRLVSNVIQILPVRELILSVCDHG